MVAFCGIPHPVVGEVSGWNRVFHTKDLSADSLFGDSNDSCLHDAPFTDSGVAICIRQVEDLAFLKHGIRPAGSNGAGFIVDSFDQKVDFSSEHIAEDLILSVKELPVVGSGIFF